MKIMIHGPLAVILLLSISIACNRGDDVTNPARPKSITASRELPAGGVGLVESVDEFPLIQCKSIQPRVELSNFKETAGVYLYSQDSKKSSEEPFENDAQAVDAAKEWIVRHFAEMPSGSELRAKSISRSASGRPKPISESDAGHTISLCQTYRGIETSLVSIIYLSGRTCNLANVHVCTIDATDGSLKKIISKEDAVESFSTIASKMGTHKEDLDRIKKDAKPSLKYIWSPKYNKDLDRNSLVYAPTWIVMGDRVVVDAYTGGAWTND
ncbi:MAG: hypothetical protein HY286_14295 [Planctomycetes bacterium]|nr:hypothetical protein [Planctomycetota bacterium]